MEPIFKTVPRTFWERLFTRPWNPFCGTKQVRDYRAEFAHVKHAPRVLGGKSNIRPIVRNSPTMRLPESPTATSQPPAGMSFGLPEPTFFPPMPDLAEPHVANVQSGGGGEFAGGGASGGWESPSSDSSSSPSSSSSDSSSSSSDSSSSSSD